MREDVRLVDSKPGEHQSKNRIAKSHPSISHTMMVTKRMIKKDTRTPVPNTLSHHEP